MPRELCYLPLGSRASRGINRGAVVNPFGLSALKGGVTIKNGRVEQGNFHQYDVVRIDEMPKVEVHIVPSQAAPGGIGEASTPGIAPAVRNAIAHPAGRFGIISSRPSVRESSNSWPIGLLSKIGLIARTPGATASPGGEVHVNCRILLTIACQIARRTINAEPRLWQGALCVPESAYEPPEAALV